MLSDSNVIAIPIGETIKEQCLIYAITLKDLAKYCEVSEIYINNLVDGKITLTVEMAEKLELVFGISSKFWLRLDNIYRKKLQVIEESKRKRRKGK